MKTLCIDMDNVLVSFKSAVDKLDKDTKVKYGENLDDVPGIFSQMLPVEGAIEAFEKLSKVYDTYILSTAPWGNDSAWTDKVRWVKKYLPEAAHKRLILSHHKNLCHGDYLIDDRLANGVDKFPGEHIHFLQGQFKTWNDVLAYLL